MFRADRFMQAEVIDLAFSSDSGGGDTEVLDAAQPDAEIKADDDAEVQGGVGMREHAAGGEPGELALPAPPVGKSWEWIQTYEKCRLTHVPMAVFHDILSDFGTKEAQEIRMHISFDLSDISAVNSSVRRSQSDLYLGRHRADSLGLKKGDKITLTHLGGEVAGRAGLHKFKLTVTSAEPQMLIEKESQLMHQFPDLDRSDSDLFFELNMARRRSSCVTIPRDVLPRMVSGIFEKAGISLEHLSSGDLPIKLKIGLTTLDTTLNRNKKVLDPHSGFRFNRGKAISQLLHSKKGHVMRLKYIGRERSDDRAFCFMGKNIGRKPGAASSSSSSSSSEDEISDEEDIPYKEYSTGESSSSEELEPSGRSTPRRGAEVLSPRVPAPESDPSSKRALSPSENPRMRKVSRKRAPWAGAGAAAAAAARGSGGTAAASPPPLPVSSAPHLPFRIIADCADCIRGSEEALRHPRLAPHTPSLAQLAHYAHILSIATDIINSGKAEHLPDLSGVFWERAAVKAVVRTSGPFTTLKHCWWVGGHVSVPDETALKRLKDSGAGISPELRAVWVGNGEMPFGLFIGAPHGEESMGVYALESIPAQKWVMQWVGVYRQDMGPAAGVYNIRTGGIGEGCVVPISDALTDQQRTVCAGLPLLNSPARQYSPWRRLPGAVIDSRRWGNAVRFLRRASQGANLEAVEIDLPYGPTGVFLCSTRAIEEGEELVLQA